MNPKGFEVATMVRRLAPVSPLSTMVAGEEPFAEVKNSITDSTNRLQSEASPEASHKSYCDDELAKASGERTLKVRCALFQA